MAPQKLVVKCGNVAVLLDVHALPRGSQEQDTSWMTAGHLEEVAALVQQAVEQRVKQHAESLHHRGQAKQRKDPPPATAFHATGTSFNLVANFLKRHSNLRCLMKDRYGELRVFAERCVVCVSRPEEASARRGNPSQAATEWGEQSRSEYFSRVGVTQEPLHSAAKTKRNALQKIVRHVGVRREDQGPGVGSVVHTGDPAGGHRASPWVGEHPGALEHRDPAPPQTLPQGVELSCPPESSIPEPQTRVHSPGDLQVQETERRNVPSQERQARAHGAAASSSSQPGPSQESRGGKRAPVGSTVGEPPAPHAKRPCLGGPPGLAVSSQTSGRDRPAPPPPPPPAVLPPLSPPLPPTAGAKAASTASPVSARRVTTGEAELLTPGKRRLPLTSAEQTNQNRPAASLTGLCARPVSPGRAIGSRGALGGEEGRENVPRVSRLRRPKRT